MNFDHYWKQLWRIKNDYDVEQYYDEIIRPIFTEVSLACKNTKVIPTFDTRCHSISHYDKYKAIIGTKYNLVWLD